MIIYITNLGHQVTNSSLEAVFATYGIVHSSRVEKNEPEQNIAFIEMPNEIHALLAISQMNGRILNGNRIIVSQAEQ